MTEDWDHLNKLGAEYRELVLQGHGLVAEYYAQVMRGEAKGVDTYPDLSNRCPRQIEIANEIALRVQPYLKILAIDAMRRPGVHIPGSNHFVRLRRGSVDEHVQDGTVGVIGKLHKYNPQYAMSTFVKLSALKEMQTMSRRNRLIKLPDRVIDRIAKLISNEKQEREVVEELIPFSTYTDGRPWGRTRALSSYHLYLDNFEDIFEDRNDSIEQDEEEPDWVLGDEHLNDKFKYFLGLLDERERDILEMRFGLGGGGEMTLKEIGLAVGLGRERVRQIENEALRRLYHWFYVARNRVNAKSLDEFLDNF